MERGKKRKACNIIYRNKKRYKLLHSISDFGIYDSVILLNCFAVDIRNIKFPTYTPIIEINIVILQDWTMLSKKSMYT